MKFCFLILVIVLLSFNAVSAETRAEEMVERYNDFLESSGIDQIESYYTNESNNKAKEYFINACGLKCKFGLSDEWIFEYARYMENMLDEKRQYFVLGARIVERNIEDVVLVLARQNCIEGRSEEHVNFVFENNKWKIKKIDIVS